MSGRMPKPTRDTPSPVNEIQIDVISDDDVYVDRGKAIPQQKIKFRSTPRSAIKRRDSNNDDLIHHPPRAKRWALEEEEVQLKSSQPFVFPNRPRGIFLPKHEVGKLCIYYFMFSKHIFSELCIIHQVLNV